MCMLHNRLQKKTVDIRMKQQPILQLPRFQPNKNNAQQNANDVPTDLIRQSFRNLQMECLSNNRANQTKQNIKLVKGKRCSWFYFYHILQDQIR